MPEEKKKTENNREIGQEISEEEPGDLEGRPWMSMVGSDGVRMHCSRKKTRIDR